MAAMGNDKAPADKLVTLTLRNPTEAQRRTLNKAVKACIALGEDGNPKVDDKGNPVLELSSDGTEEYNKLLLELGIDGVNNYMGANKKQIKTGAEFWEHAEPDMYTDVLYELSIGYKLTEAAGYMA